MIDFEVFASSSGRFESRGRESEKLANRNTVALFEKRKYPIGITFDPRPNRYWAKIDTGGSH
jgi:hypothetical protein